MSAKCLFQKSQVELWQVYLRFRRRKWLEAHREMSHQWLGCFFGGLSQIRNDVISLNWGNGDVSRRTTLWVNSVLAGSTSRYSFHAFRVYGSQINWTYYFYQTDSCAGEKYGACSSVLWLSEWMRLIRRQWRQQIWMRLLVAPCLYLMSPSRLKHPAFTWHTVVC